MPRPILIRTENFVYHVTVRSNNKEWFYIPIRECWEIFTRALGQSATRYKSEIHTLVLMSNHLHLLLSTPNRNVDQVMRYFLSVSTARIQRRAGRINHIFGGRYKWSVLEGASSLAYVYKYVVRNPVRAGMCERVENYSFSTLTDLESAVGIAEGFSPYWKYIPRNFIQRLDWLNYPTPRELEQLIARGLRRNKFAFTTASNLQKRLRELKESYGVPDENAAPAPFGT